ncbi:hypothetical protein Scep_001101 [Stephania cephalantha]|uniref:Uncharacterized protein n=1 Tax=Stephania cephalantha TaxID=152367 RepID=A0AAP0Q3H6_9MAGN
MGVDDEKRRALLDPKNHNTETEYEDDDDDDEEEEEEALSLCDLPVSETKQDSKQSNNNETRPLLQADRNDDDDDDHFEFGSWGGPVFTESEMCAAEDVFFQGQILPLRLSIASDNCASRCNSRSSESTELCCSSSSTGFTSTTSRSSSNSSNGSALAASNSTSYKPKARNLFHSHPSPKPQLWFSNSKPKKQSTRNRGSTIWGLFRPGLVQTPEIELQSYPKLRDAKRFNSSGSSESKVKLGGKKKQKQRRFGFESCRCSVDAIGTVSSRVVVRKSKVKGGEIKEEKKQKQRREALHQRRTFEWLKELSINGDDGVDGANCVSRS